MHLRPVDGCTSRSALGRRLHINSGASIVQTMVVEHKIAYIESHDEYEELRSVRPSSEYNLVHAKLANQETNNRCLCGRR